MNEKSLTTNFYKTIDEWLMQKYKSKQILHYGYGDYLFADVRTKRA